MPEFKEYQQELSKYQARLSKYQQEVNEYNKLQYAIERATIGKGTGNKKLDKMAQNIVYGRMGKRPKKPVSNIEYDGLGQPMSVLPTKSVSFDGLGQSVSTKPLSNVDYSKQSSINKSTPFLLDTIKPTSKEGLNRSITLDKDDMGSSTRKSNRSNNNNLPWYEKFSDFKKKALEEVHKETKESRKTGKWGKYLLKDLPKSVFSEIGNEVFIKTPLGIYKFAKDPKTGVIEIASGIRYLVTNPKEVASDVWKEAKINPEKGIGSLTGNVIVGYGAGVGISKTLGKVSSKLKKFGTTYVPEELAWGDDVLTKGKRFPSATSVDDIMYKFGKSKADDIYKGAHATTTKFDDVAKIGGTHRLEDQGLFMSSWSEGSPHFLGVADKTGYKLSLNPFKNWKKNPNLLKISFKNLDRLPTNIRNKFKTIMNSQGKAKAYEYINKWYDDFAKPETAYIPMRSEIWETAEIQAVIPKGSSVELSRQGNWLQKLRGYKEHTTYKGKTIPIREFSLLGGDDVAKKLSITGDVIRINDLTKKYPSLSSYAQDSSKYVTPQQSLLPLVSSYQSPTYQSSQPYSTPSSYSSGNYNNDYKRGYNYYPQTEYTGYATPPPTYSEGYSPYKGGYTKPYPPKIIIPYKRPIATNKGGFLVKKSQNKDAWQPIVFRDDGTRVPGDYFETQRGATNEGFIATDELPETKFAVKKASIPAWKIKKARNAQLGYKFKQRGNLFIEKSTFRKDHPRESSFNWMQYLRPAR